MRGGHFFWWRKPEYQEKTTDLSQVTDKLNVVSSTPCHEQGLYSQLWLQYKENNVRYTVTRQLPLIVNKISVGNLNRGHGV